VKILEVERMALTKPAAQNGTASRPFHAARGLTVDSLVRVILSQALTNEVALDMQQALIFNYPYMVDGKVYEGTKPNYHHIREQSMSKLLRVLSGAGLQGVKTIPIKACLDIIYAKNLSLLKPGEVVYHGQEPDAKDFVPGLLSMDFIWDAYRQGGKQAAFNVLTSLPQVGVKTAACLMSFNMGIPVFAVDTHVAAMSKLLG
jgi:endonuclease III